MLTLTVTFSRDTDEDDFEVKHVTVETPVDLDELNAGEWDAHELVVTRARSQETLGDEWDAQYVRVPGTVEHITVPAGL